MMGELVKNHIIPEHLTIKEALKVLNTLSGDALTLLVVDDNEVMVGTLTDGDIRRKIIEGISLEESVSWVMHKNFSFLKAGSIDVGIIRRCRVLGIVLLPCLDIEGKICKVYNLKKTYSVLPLDVVLMAGGRGERLRPLTDSVPKPLLKIGDKTIIDYNIERLLDCGIENLYVTVNYLAEQLEEHFKDKRGNVKIRCVREKEYLGTLGAAGLIEEYENDLILVMNSDLFTNIDFEEFYLYFKESGADMAVAAIPYSVAVPYGIFKIDGDRVVDVEEKPVYNYYANSGIYLIKRELLSLIPKNQYFNATDLIRMVVGRGGKVVRFPLMGYWIDIGKLEDYKKAQEFAKHL